MKQKVVRQKINAALRTAVWNKYVGEELGISKCYVGCGTGISQSTFQCGHVVASSKGGSTDVYNLRPVCQRCNTSMGTEDMFEFMHRLGFVTDSRVSEVPVSKPPMFPHIEELMRQYSKK